MALRNEILAECNYLLFWLNLYLCNQNQHHQMGRCHYLCKFHVDFVDMEFDNLSRICEQRLDWLVHLVDNCHLVKNSLNNLAFNNFNQHLCYNLFYLQNLQDSQKIITLQQLYQNKQTDYDSPHHPPYSSEFGCSC
jgi:hypothetical protein